MARIDIPDGEDLERIRLWTMTEGLTEAIDSFRTASHEKTLLSRRVREVARMRSAVIKQCPIWLDTRSSSGTDQKLSESEYSQIISGEIPATLSSEEVLALQYAEYFCLDHESLDDDFFTDLKRHFSDAQIVDLSGYVAFCLGLGRVYKVLDVANECPVIH